MIEQARSKGGAGTVHTHVGGIGREPQLLGQRDDGHALDDHPPQRKGILRLEVSQVGQNAGASKIALSERAGVVLDGLLLHLGTANVLAEFTARDLEEPGASGIRISQRLQLAHTSQP